jgi:uncharacterized protein (DUF4415 family)
MLTTIEKKTKTAEEEMDLQLGKMKRLPRGSFKAQPNATNSENCKVKISMYLDGDILAYFRQRAEQPNAAPYQTQINTELRKIIEADSLGKTGLDKSILEDTEFLKALKEKLETV